MEKIHTLEFYQNNFLEELKKKEKSQNTLKNYKTDLHCFNKFLIQKKGNLKLLQLTSSEVYEYQHFLEENYPSPNSRRRRVQALRIFFDYLIAKNLFDSNPVKKILVSPKVVEKPNPITFETIQKILILLRGEYKEKKGFEKFLALRNIFLIHLIYESALKVSDLSKLKEEHFLKGKNGELRILIAHEKRDPYTVKLSQNFAPLFECYKKGLEKYKDENSLNFDEVFFNGNSYKILSGGLSPRGIELIFNDLSKRIKEKITARDLRQSAIYKWIDQNHPESTIKEWMGVVPSYSLKPFFDHKKGFFPDLPLESILC